MSAYQTAARGAQPATPRRRNGTAKKHQGEPVPVVPEIAARVVPRGESGGGPLARILVTLQNGAEVEVTRTVVAALAHALWESRGGDHLTNWLDAERVLDHMVGFKPGAGSTPPPRAGRALPKDDDDLFPPDYLPRGRARRR